MQGVGANVSAQPRSPGQHCSWALTPHPSGLTHKNSTPWATALLSQGNRCGNSG